jgi:hypothetical protein
MQSKPQSSRFRLCALLAASILGLAVADLGARSGSVGLRQYEAWLVRGQGAIVPGLWPGASVSAELRVHALRDVPAFLRAGAAPLRLSPGTTGIQDVVIDGVVDPDGVLALRWSPRGSLQIGRVVFHQNGPRGIPLWRLIQYAWLVALAWAWGRVVGGEKGGASAVGAVWLTLSAALVAGYRVQALVFLPWLLLLLALALVMALAARLAQLPRGAAAFVTGVFLVRAVIALQPGFPSIDAAFHSENVQRFLAGDVIRSTAPGAEGRDVPVPYPPAFYALVAPFVGVDWPTPQFPVVVAIALLEGTLPLLLFLLARAAGASATASALAACVLVALPESTLVLGKGIAANSLGQWITVCLFLALVRRAPSAILAGLFALVFLSHFGASLIVVAFLCCWAALSLSRGGSGRYTARVLLCAGVGTGLAWLVYYREVQTLTESVAGDVASRAARHADAFFGVRWYRVGKALQDLLLKFGAFPLVAGLVGLRRPDLSPELRALLSPWLMAGAGLGLVAILTPVPLRFEYFLCPAVALAAGLGAAGMTRRGQWLTLAVPLVVQALLLAFLSAQRFNLISVILESPRWPFPFRL